MATAATSEAPATAQGQASAPSSKPSFDLQAHRGGRGLLPENTLAAFANAIQMGVTTLELDIAITADSVAVISHDPYLNPAITREPSGKWLAERGPNIKSLTLAQLQSYDVGRINPATKYASDFSTQQARDGERIPTLAALFELVKKTGANNIQFDIETKIDPGFAQRTLPPAEFVAVLLKAITDAGMAERVMVQSFDWRTLQLLHKLAPSLRTTYLTIESPNFNNLATGAWTGGMRLAEYASTQAMVRASAGAAQGVTWSPNFRNLSAAAVKDAQTLGLKVIPWTVNQKEDMAQLVDWGVDGIITDYPDRLRQLMAERGMALPTPPQKRQ